MCGRGTGIAPSPNALRITLPAVPAASSAAPLSCCRPTTTCCASPELATTAHPGSPVTGSALGPVATSTTLPIAKNVSAAMLPGTLPPAILSDPLHASPLAFWN
ncbi:unnamed protein product [Cuscuta europaea]|uniref:Uncharacterized protein n=1 Tax=Cuscuta europaea TaxID=41803 RepID=A0A9P0YRR5_CUSEU|nr:unnamed protein product [Cuscuta europaea]